MATTLESKINVARLDLDAALESVEQKCQSIRWRLAHFAIDQAVPDLETEIESLMKEAGRVAEEYGQLKALMALTIVTQADEGNEANDGSIPFGPEVVGFAATSPVLEDADEMAQSKAHGTPVSEPSPAVTTYNVVQFFGDTEIVAVQGQNGEYLTFEAAKAAAIDYLEDVIDVCELTIHGLRDADTPEQYFGTEVATTPKSQGNVRMICGDHYMSDPEVQGKPLSWFVGKLVKLRFTISGRPTNSELMWVAVTSIREDGLVGTLTNEPLYADHCCGDEIVFRREEVLVVHENDLAASGAA